jgi:hypothetical protein
VKAKDVPPFHEALKELAIYFPIFYDAFESADAHVKEYLEGLQASFDPWLHAHLVRHYVKLDLRNHELEAEDFKPENLAMSGLSFRIGRWFLRMRKSERGEVPPPGHSRILNEYYRQQKLPGEFSETHNLLLLWHANFIGDFKGLSLVYPLTADVIRWKADIPHPAQTVDEATTLDQPEFDMGDLPIEALEAGDETFEADDDEDNQAENL